jgi:hypothetical protein
VQREIVEQLANGMEGRDIVLEGTVGNAWDTELSEYVSSI